MDWRRGREARFQRDDNGAAAGSEAGRCHENVNQVLSIMSACGTFGSARSVRARRLVRSLMFCGDHSHVGRQAQYGNVGEEGFWDVVRIVPWAAGLLTQCRREGLDG